jgi:SAM-dependent methyltransferase
MQNNKRIDSFEEASYDPVFFKRLALIEDKHFWFHTRNDIIKLLIEQMVGKFPKGYRVLEIGCGTGNVLRVLSKACSQGMVIGTDLYFEGLKFARSRLTCPLIQADLSTLPFQSKFDLIGLFDVLEHISNDKQALMNLSNRINPGGVLFITVPAHPSLWSYSDDGARHYRRYSAAELETKLRSAGFEIDYLTQYMATTFLLVWIARKFRGLMNGNKPYSYKEATRLTMSEFKVTPIINPILYTFLKFESWIVSRRFKLPFGTSLLALAYKPVL